METNNANGPELIRKLLNNGEESSDDDLTELLREFKQSAPVAFSFLCTMLHDRDFHEAERCLDKANTDLCHRLSRSLPRLAEILSGEGSQMPLPPSAPAFGRSGPTRGASGTKYALYLGENSNAGIFNR